MSDAVDSLLAGWVTVPRLIANGDLPYQTPRPAEKFLERLGVPYVVICRRKHYRAADIRQAIDHETQASHVQRERVHKPDTAGPI